MLDVILVVNSGSSSLKFALYPIDDNQCEPLVKGKVTGIGRQPELSACIGDEALSVTKPFKNISVEATHEWLIENLLLRLYSRYVVFNPIAAGHRVVHGGSEFTEPVFITDVVLEKLQSLCPLAPLHQPHSLAAIQAIAKYSPDLPQFACFDTAFHNDQPRIEKLFAIPREYAERGILRYGFHGISYEYIAQKLPEYLGAEKANGRVIVAHLGNGASICALHNRKSVASSMGFSTLEGLIMGTRCGNLDAGVLLHMLQQEGLQADEIEKILYKESGLKGISGISNNMQVLENSDASEAKEAIELFCYRAVRQIGALTAALGGLDALVFTAGIGENSLTVRKKTCESLEWLGTQLNETANQANENKISTENSAVDVHVIATNEEAMIAMSTSRLIKNT